MSDLYCDAKAFEHKDDWYVEIEVDGVLLRKKHDSKVLAEATIEQLPRLGPTFFEHLEDWYKWKPINKETDKMHKLFGIKKTIDPLKCVAMRCKEARERYLDGAPWDLPGMSLPICGKHVKEVDDSEDIPDTGNVAMVKATIAEVDDALETAEALEIETQEDLDDVQTWLVEIKGMLNKVLEAKEAVLVPLRSLTSDARDVFKPAEHKLQALESVLKGKLIEAKKRMQADNQEALDEGAEATAKGEKNNGVAKLKEFGGVKGVSTSSKWKWKLTGDVTEVADDYLRLVVDDKALTALCTGAKSKPQSVEGIEFYEDIGVSVRA